MDQKESQGTEKSGGNRNPKDKITEESKRLNSPVLHAYLESNEDEQKKELQEELSENQKIKDEYKDLLPQIKENTSSEDILSLTYQNTNLIKKKQRRHSQNTSVTNSYLSQNKSHRNTLQNYTSIQGSSYINKDRSA